MMLQLPFFEPGHRSLRSRLRKPTPAFEAIASRGEAGEVDEAGRETIRICASLGLCRLLVPRAFGGDGPAGLDLRTLCVIRESLASCSGLADAVLAVQGLGSYPLALSGHSEMSERLLRAVANGDAIAAFALTEPGAGSDVGAISTRATRDGDHYVLDGAKTFISNATIASFFVVFARTAAGPRRALSAFVVERDTPGLTISRVQHITAPHPIGGLRLQGCRISAAHRLGEEGDGMRIALGTLDFFRTSVGAAACGLGSRALKESIARAKSRTQFGAAIGEFQLIQSMLAEMATDLEAARLLVYRAAWLKDHGQARLTRESAMAKLFATEAAQRIVDRAVQIHGGLGVERGSVVERLYREVRPPRIYEGTSEIQKLVIARDVLQDHGFD